MEPGRRSPITPEQFAALPAKAFDWMTVEQRVRLFQFFIQNEFEAREFICGVDNHEPPDGMYLVCSGEVRLTYRPNNGRTRPIEVRGPGEVFGFDPRDREAGPFRARASCRTRVLFLAQGTAAQIARTMPDIAMGIRRVMLQLRFGSTLLAAIQHTPVFRNATAQTVEFLMRDAEERTLPEGPYVRAGEAPRGLCFVVSGELERSLPSAAGGRFVDVRGPGGILGEAAIFEALFSGAAAATTLTVHRVVEAGSGAPASEPLDVDVRGEAHVIEVPLETCLGVLRRFPFLHDTRVSAERARECELIVFTHDGQEPMGKLLELLARTAAREHFDRVAIIELAELPAGHAEAPPRVELIEEGVKRITIRGNSSLTQASRDGMMVSAFDAFDYVLINGHGLPAVALAGLAQTTRVRRACHLTRDTFAPLPVGLPGMESILYATLLRDTRPAAEGPAFRPGTVRLGFRPGSLAGATLEGLDADARADLKRWVRAITRRRVGVALGGGGAWGFAHVPFLRELLARGIPIDVVTGASFGSVAGAYFASAAGTAAGGWGARGLEQLVADRVPLSQAVSKAMFSSRFLREAIDGATGHHARHLEGLAPEGAAVPGDEAEVGDHRRVIRADEDVRRLQVAVDDAVGVERGERAAEAVEEVEHLLEMAIGRPAAHRRGAEHRRGVGGGRSFRVGAIEREGVGRGGFGPTPGPVPREASVERSGFEELHGVPGLAPVRPLGDDPHDTGVPHPRERARFRADRHHPPAGRGGRSSPPPTHRCRDGWPGTRSPSRLRPTWCSSRRVRTATA